MTEYNDNELNISDADLDLLLAEWAEAEVELPENFHESVMTRLRAEQNRQTPQKNGPIVSLSEWFANKKTWVPAVAVAALVLCCLPILQERQENLAGVENSVAQVYDMKSRTMDSDGTAEPQLMRAVMDTPQEATSADTVNGAVEKTALPAPAAYDASYEYTSTNSRAEMTPEEQLALAQDNLAELEAHLSVLDDSTEAQSQRAELQSKIDELKVEIKALEEQINTEE